VARPEGTLLDGTPLKDALSSIDTEVKPKPMAYMINCTHASFFKSALLNKTHSSDFVRKRVIGLFANTAALNPEELNGSHALVEEDPEIFGENVGAIYKELGMKILGGCCGTDDRHIRSLAKELSESI
jgi:homocysteine S-methyltransferase